jgi:indolepyruvate ferredoxin oxidoreductase beta subunit
MNPYNILIAGVGGQGNLLLGRVIAEAAADKGFRPVVGETFGASRRGGTVFTHLRFSDMDLGPLVPKGTLNLLVGLEPMEALRAAIKFAGEDTVIVVSQEPIQSPSNLSGESEYPAFEDIIRSLNELSKEVHIFDTDTILKKIGTHRVLNTFFLGVIAELGITPLDKQTIEVALTRTIGPSAKNEEAFQAGINAISSTS